MADAELVALTEDTVPLLTDLLYKVDSAGTTDRRVQIGNLAASGWDIKGSPNGYAAGELRFQGGGATLGTSIGVDTVSMNFDHRANANTGQWYWRNGTGGTTVRMRLDPNANLLCNGADNKFGQGANGGAGQYVYIRDFIDGSNVGVTCDGSATNLNMLIRSKGNGAIALQTSAGATKLQVDTTGIGFFGAGTAAKPTVTGSRGGNAALASALTALAGLGLLTDSSTA